LARTSIDDVITWSEVFRRPASGEQFQGPNFLRPYQFALLGAELLRRGPETTIRMPDYLVGYAARMRLWQATGRECPVTVRERNPGGRFHPLSPIRAEADVENTATAVTDVFRQAGTRDAETIQAISTVLSEIFGNCYFHSESATDIRGLACAQTWPAIRLAQIAVADIGIGIRASLAANPAYADRLASGNALELATELGVTSKPHGAHAGYGLAVARQLMEMHDGRLLVVSGNEAFGASNRGYRRKNLDAAMPGTLVVLEWNTAEPLNIGKVYASWPTSGDVDELF
jgi:anti-sigma regulatory factor (Ser/Thr protein kinase)